MRGVSRTLRGLTTYIGYNREMVRARVLHPLHRHIDLLQTRRVCEMLEMRLAVGPQTIFEVASFATLAGRPIATAAHCLGCTAGAGSSCGGAIQ